MEIIYSDDFIKSAKIIPKPIKKKLADLLRVVQNNQFHPKLHTKPLTGKLGGFYSFRITRDWRVIFKFVNLKENKNIFLIDVAHRKDIYR